MEERVEVIIVTGIGERFIGIWMRGLGLRFRQSFSCRFLKRMLRSRDGARICQL